MYDSSIADRFVYLLAEHGKNIYDVAAGTGLSTSYLDELKKGKKENPSSDVLERIAEYFNVPPAFFARKPQHYLPPVPPAQVQMALRNVGNLDPAARATLDQLVQRAREISVGRRKETEGAPGRGPG